MRKPVQSNAEEGCLPCRSEAVFASERCKCGTKKQTCTNVVGRLGRSSLNSLGSSILIYSAFIGYIAYSAKWGRVRARKKESESIAVNID